MLKSVEETPKGPRLVLSRGDPMFVKALFKLEVPEIQQGIVEIRAPRAKSAAARRSPCSRATIRSIRWARAWASRARACRPSCRNSAASASTSCPWSSDPERFAKLALAPAKVARVFSDPATKTIQAVVDEDQLSLAIGRNGQNVRLASELTGWKIDLYSSREWLERGGDVPLFQPLPEEEREAAADVKLSDIEGLPPATVAVLEAGGYKTLNDIIDLEREDFLKLPGIAPEEADRLMAFINEVTAEGGGEENDAADAAAPEGGATV